MADFNKEVNDELVLLAHEEYQKRENARLEAEKKGEPFDFEFSDEANEIFNKFFEQNKKLIYSFYRDNSGWIKANYLTFDDFFIDAMESLFDAVRLFDPQKGEFSTYATDAIKGEVVNQMKYNSRKMRTGEVISLDQKIKEESDSTQHDFIKDEKSDEFPDKIVSEMHVQKLIKTLKLFLSDVDIMLLNSQLKGGCTLKKFAHNKTTATHQWTTLRYQQIKTLLRGISSLRHLENFDKRENDEYDVNKHHFYYECARYVYGGQPMDFDICYPYLKPSERIKGLLKKLEFVFQDNNLCQYVLRVLATMSEVNMQEELNKEKGFNNVVAKRADLILKKKVDSLISTAKMLKLEIDNNDEKSKPVEAYLMNYAIIERFRPYPVVLKHILSNVNNSISKNTASHYKEKQAYLAMIEEKVKLDMFDEEEDIFDKIYKKEDGLHMQ